ncbi:response regulator [candidate division WOR-3 bacterium]|uniref:Response regulator n=1 Tax=candidate division WOR-3 bacterium TaxID=2052148 RepID=A0A9D5QD70_UNCW3|nr:response regulator [candidate division WOR-3 bacterium]MBD3363780.1 response regulator [candidate division WOR-3 bacterium]
MGFMETKTFEMKSKKRILLVDDEEQFTYAVSDILTSHGYLVDTENRGEAAIKRFKPGEYGLLITDINMPDMDGVELIRRIQEIYPDQKVVVITGFPSYETQEETLKLGALNFLVKPFTPERFLEVVRKAINDKSKRLIGPVELNCEDLIQIYALDAKDAVLEIRKGGEIGRIYFRKGEIIHAETSRNKGEEAFYEILGWESGTFKVEPVMEPESCTIDAPVTSLLLEGSRRMDESVSKGSKWKDKGSITEERVKGRFSPEDEQTVRAYLRALRKYDKEVKMAFENMKDVDILRYVVQETDGAIAAGLVSLDGISMGVYNTIEGFDTKAADAEFASMLRSGQKAAENLGPAFGDVEELMLAGANGIVIVRMIGDKYYAGIALAKDGNIGKARMLQQKLVKEMTRRYYAE